MDGLWQQLEQLLQLGLLRQWDVKMDPFGGHRNSLSCLEPPTTCEVISIDSHQQEILSEGSQKSGVWWEFGELPVVLLRPVEATLAQSDGIHRLGGPVLLLQKPLANHQLALWWFGAVICPVFCQSSISLLSQSGSAFQRKPGDVNFPTQAIQRQNRNP